MCLGALVSGDLDGDWQQQKQRRPAFACICLYGITAFLRVMVQLEPARDGLEAAVHSSGGLEASPKET
jgi:hypothetical protein